MSTPGLYCDGETLHSSPVDVEWQPDGAVRVMKGSETWSVPGSEYTITDQLGAIPRFLRFKHGGVIELHSTGIHADFKGASHSSLESAIHWLESRTSVAAVALVLVVLTVALGLWQGAPRLARRAAFAAPASIEQQAGEVGLSVFTRSFKPTQLNRFDQQQVQRQLDRLTATRSPHVTPKIVFLSMGTANAFALPGGTIVVADELIDLAENDDEIAAVLAHELGHIENRHGLQSVLRNSTALVVVSSVTGDLSTLSTFSATLPFLLLQYGYAREFETEADQYAIGLLKDAHIDSSNLANILDALEKARPEKGPDFSYLSTHPSTSDRIKALGGTQPRAQNKKKNRAATADAAFTTIASRQADKPADSSLVRLNQGRLPESGSGHDSATLAAQPRRIFSPHPQYPSELRAANVTGEALIEFVVTSEGRVANVKIVKASHPLFGKAAADAVGLWLFEPGKVKGRPVNTLMQQPISFSLEDSEPPSKEDIGSAN
jgi:TonB family protein